MNRNSFRVSFISLNSSLPEEERTTPFTLQVSTPCSNCLANGKSFTLIQKLARIWTKQNQPAIPLQTFPYLRVGVERPLGTIFVRRRSMSQKGDERIDASTRWDRFEKEPLHQGREARSIQRFFSEIDSWEESIFPILLGQKEKKYNGLEGL